MLFSEYMVGESLVPREPVCNLREGILARLPRGLDQVRGRGGVGGELSRAVGLQPRRAASERLAAQPQPAWLVPTVLVREKQHRSPGSWSPSRYRATVPSLFETGAPQTLAPRSPG